MLVTEFTSENFRELQKMKETMFHEDVSMEGLPYFPKRHKKIENLLALQVLSSSVSRNIKSYKTNTSENRYSYKISSHPMSCKYVPMQFAPGIRSWVYEKWF